MTYEERAGFTRNIESSYMSEDAEGIPVPKTASAALMSIGTHLQVTQPPEGDPRANVHKQQMRELKLAEETLTNAGTPEKQLETPGQRDREGVTHVDPPARHYQEGADARNYITQKQVDRSRANRASSSQDFDPHSNINYEPGGASCFTLNIRSTRMPKGFRLTAEIVEFDGTQDPRLWLEDYLIACNCQGGNQITAMQYLQLMLTESARGWLQSIPKNSFSKWEEFEEAFVKNFLGTYSRPGTLVEMKACKQHRGESLRAFIA